MFRPCVLLNLFALKRITEVNDKTKFYWKGGLI